MAGKGSKPGERRGGRKKGTPNKATTAAAIRAEVAASGEIPLDYMLRVMRDETADPARRDAMAKAAAPYVHPSLASVRHGGDEQNPLRITEVRRIIVDARQHNSSTFEKDSQ
jgi:hypothetical protein